MKAFIVVYVLDTVSKFKQHYTTMSKCYHATIFFKEYILQQELYLFSSSYTELMCVCVHFILLRRGRVIERLCMK